MKHSFKLVVGLAMSSLMLSGCSATYYADYYIEGIFGGSPKVYEKCGDGLTPVLSDDGKTVTYGLYPQTNVDDENLVSKLNTLSSPVNEWYEYEGEWYAKVAAKASISFVQKFDNGQRITPDAIYWFKCEPIVWNIMSSNDGEYQLVSNLILDNQRFADLFSFMRDDPTNNYSSSLVRYWLTRNFYKSAFRFGDDYIQTVEVDNSASTTESSNNRYVCENTEDKIYLLSYKDYNDMPKETKRALTSDWARANGVMMFDILYENESSFYWTRSPFSLVDNSAWTMKVNTLVPFKVTEEGGVRPAITVRID